MLYALFAITLGCVAVLQATANRSIALSWGLAPAVLLNGTVLVALAVAFFVFVRSTQPSGFFLNAGATLAEFRWWWFLPGVIGFSLVAGIPLLIDRIGALRVFVGIVAAQMLVSVAWDAAFEKTPASLTRVLGALLAVASVALVSWK